MTNVVVSLDPPDSPLRPPGDEKAGGSAAPDSSTVCAASPHVSNSPMEDVHSSSSQAPEPAAITSTFSASSAAAAFPPFPTKTQLSSCSAAQTQTACLGQRRKGLARKCRRNQRPRGRHGGPALALARETGDRRLEEEMMEEDTEQDVEKMEEETTQESLPAVI